MQSSAQSSEKRMVSLGTFPNLQTTQTIWVGRWHKRYVVFDPSIQPKNEEFILLYFVQGQSLCLRKRWDEEKITSEISDQNEKKFALDQYSHWFSANRDIVADKQSRTVFEVENPPDQKTFCPKCDGQGTWYDVVNKVSYGVQSEGPNVREICDLCLGNGFVDDTF